MGARGIGAKSQRFRLIVPPPGFGAFIQAREIPAFFGRIDWSSKVEKLKYDYNEDKTQITFLCTVVGSIRHRIRKFLQNGHGDKMH